MKVVVSDQVRAFLSAERIYLRKHGTKAWPDLSRRFREAKVLLTGFPLAGAKKNLPSAPNVRRLVVGDYVLDYEAGADLIAVLHMRHGKQADHDLAAVGDDFDFEA